jgi:flagellar hook-length control protein FliK
MSTNAFMPPVPPQTPAPDLTSASGKSPAAFKSNRLGGTSDQRESFSATLERISERKHHPKPNSAAGEKPAKTHRGSHTETPRPEKTRKTNAPTPDDIEENKAPVSEKESRPVDPWMAFGLIPYHFIDDLAAKQPPDSTTQPGLRMLADLIAHLQSQGLELQGQSADIGPFEQLQATVSPDALNRFFFRQLAAWAIHHQDSGDLMVKAAQEGTLSPQPGASGVDLNGPFNWLLRMLKMTGTAGGLNSDTNGSGGLKMAASPESTHLNADLLLKMTSPSRPPETGMSENAKMALAGHEGRFPFWSSGNSNSETLLDTQARQLSENLQAFKSQASLKAATQPSANPNSTAEGIPAKAPEAVFGLKSAVPKTEILPIEALGNKIVQIDGESKDSSFLFSQTQMPEHLARLENAAQRSEAAQRGLMSQTLNQIVQKAVLSLNNGQHEVQIDLKPDFLGHIRMQIVTESHQVAVRIFAELPLVKDMLESNLNQLRAELQAQGLKVDQLEVSVAHDSQTDDDKHQKAAEVIRTRGLKNSRLSLDAAAEEQTDMPAGRADGIVESAIDYFA